MTIKRVAVIGAGAAGAAAAAALHAEDYFDQIKVYERRETAGGTWIYDADPGVLPLEPGALPTQTDPPLVCPSRLPATTKPCSQFRFQRTPIYQDLTTNVPDVAMSFSDLPFAYGPFVPHRIPREYIESYFSFHRTDALIEPNTTVEDLSRLAHDRWKLILRRHDAARHADDWWEEEFDAVVVANGHYSVPFIPAVPGLPAYLRKFPGRVEHSKTFRTPRAYAGRTVVVVGNSASGHDVSQILLKSGLPKGPLYISRRSRGRWDRLEPEPGSEWKPVISEYKQDGSIVFADGSILRNVDRVIYCTGYKVSYPFWNEANNGRPLWDYKLDRLIANYQHTFVRDFPTLAFIGIPRVLTFRSFEYQAVALARLWSGRNAKPMPSLEKQELWERNRDEQTQPKRRKFHQIDWDDGETMDWFRWLFLLAGLPQLEDRGRYPPVLTERTRWAIENVKKYPDPDVDLSGQCEAWTLLNGPDRKDSLSFI